MTTPVRLHPTQEITLPWAIRTSAMCIINGTRFAIEGTGRIPTHGVYDADLDFEKIPSQFHPSALASFLISACCGAGASMRNGGVNMSTMGAEEYAVRRRLRFSTGGKIDMSGTARFTPAALVLDVEVNGDVRLPDDVSPHCMYIKRVEPVPGTDHLIGVGEGSLFRRDGAEISLLVDTKYTLISPKASELARPLAGPEFRILSEDGELDGTRYHSRIHSIFDGINSMQNVATRPFADPTLN